VQLDAGSSGVVDVGSCKVEVAKPGLGDTLEVVSTVKRIKEFEGKIGARGKACVIADAVELAPRVESVVKCMVVADQVADEVVFVPNVSCNGIYWHYGVNKVVKDGCIFVNVLNSKFESVKVDANTYVGYVDDKIDVATELVEVENKSLVAIEAQTEANGVDDGREVKLKSGSEEIDVGEVLAETRANRCGTLAIEERRDEVKGASASFYALACKDELARVSVQAGCLTSAVGNEWFGVDCGHINKKLVVVAGRQESAKLKPDGVGKFRLEECSDRGVGVCRVGIGDKASWDPGGYGGLTGLEVQMESELSVWSEVGSLKTLMKLVSLVGVRFKMVFTISF
jgi:hypothetical protein